MDVGTISAAVTSARTAGSMISALIGMKSGAEVNAKAIELQTVVLDLLGQLAAAQSAHFDLKEQLRAAEDKNRQKEDFRGDMERYQLASPWPGSVVYALKEAMANGEPPHYLCANCHQVGKKSILAVDPDTNRWTRYACPNCNSSVATGFRGSPPAEYAPA